MLEKVVEDDGEDITEAKCAVCGQNSLNYANEQEMMSGVIGSGWHVVFCSDPDIEVKFYCPNCCE